MALRVTSGVVAPIIVLAAGTAFFRIYDAPERIQKRQALAKETCDKAGGVWVMDARQVPSCKRD